MPHRARAVRYRTYEQLPNLVCHYMKALRFAFMVRVEPSAENGLTMPSVVMVFQMRAIDKARIIRKLGQMSAADMNRIDAVLWQMLRPPNALTTSGSSTG